MKETGVVRRIDELGRIVVPKEIRKTLRIREGDPLEIFTESDSVILKKFSSIGRLEELGKELTSAIADATCLGCVIFDMDKVVALAGRGWAKYGKAKINREVLEVLRGRKEYFMESKNTYKKIDIMFDDDRVKSIAIFPIVAHGDVYGGLCLMSEKEEIKHEEVLIGRIGTDFICKGIE